MAVQCGFSSPVTDNAKNDLSHTDFFEKNRDATLIIEARGNSIIDAGIFESDILMIDVLLNHFPVTLSLPTCKASSL